MQSTLEFYNTIFRSVGFEFGGIFDVNNHSIELKYYSATPYCIQMAEFHIKDKQDMQYFWTTSPVEQVEEVKYEKLKALLHSPFQGYPNPLKENTLWKASNGSHVCIYLFNI